MKEDLLRRRVALRNAHERRPLRRIDLDATDSIPRCIPQIDEHRTKDTEARRGALLCAARLAPLLLLVACASTPSEPTEPALPDPRGAAPATLEVGDPAPPILISQWIGAVPPSTVALAPIAVDGVAPRFVPLAPDTITMIDFWASWCGPCLASMERTARMQARHAPALRVVPMTAIDDANTLEAIIRATRATQGFGTLGTAVDDGSRTSIAFRVAARETMLPRAFLIDRDGRVAWIGHPIEAEVVVDEMLAGRWDRDAERSRREELARARRQGQELLESLQRAVAIGDGEAQVSTLVAIAALAQDAAPIPRAAARAQLVEHLNALGRVDEARGELHAAADESRQLGDAEALAALARTATTFDPAEALTIALESERIIDRTLAAWDAERAAALEAGRGAARDTNRDLDSWILFERAARRRDFSDACLQLAEVHRSLQRADDAARLDARAVALGAEPPLSSAP